jgi:hypothetical protein
MSGNFSVIVDANDELLAKGFGLPEGICVAEMYHIVAAMTRKQKLLLNFKFPHNFATFCLDN